MTTLRPRLTAEIAITALLLFAIGVRTCHRPSPTTTAKDVVHAARDYAAEERAAQAQIAAAWTEAEAARVRSDSLAAASQRSDVRARVAQHHADSIAASIVTAVTPHDSSEDWRAAYVARTEEAGELRASRDSARLALASQQQRAVALVRIDTTQDRLLVKADNVIHTAVAVATAEHCTVPGTFGFVDCPSGTMTFVAGVATAIVVTVVWQHKDALTKLSPVHIGLSLSVP